MLLTWQRWEKPWSDKYNCVRFLLQAIRGRDKVWTSVNWTLLLPPWVCRMLVVYTFAVSSLSHLPPQATNRASFLHRPCTLSAQIFWPSGRWNSTLISEHFVPAQLWQAPRPMFSSKRCRSLLSGRGTIGQFYLWVPECPIRSLHKPVDWKWSTETDQATCWIGYETGISK